MDTAEIAAGAKHGDKAAADDLPCMEIDRHELTIRA
jgi:hypothetical protein